MALSSVMYSSHFLQSLRKANLVPLADELAKSNKINLSQLPEENERVVRQLQDKHMKDLIQKTKVFQSEIFSNLHWRNCNRVWLIGVLRRTLLGTSCVFSPKKSQ